MEDREDIFKEYGEWGVNLQMYGMTKFVSLEEMYQAFKQRYDADKATERHRIPNER